MRVLEADPSISYKMGKNRKHRIRKARENATADVSSDEAQATGCPHISKAINLTSMRKTISRPSVSVGECSVCCKEGTKSTTRDLFGNVNESSAQAAEGEEAEGEPTICLCLQCGHQGCDRYSLNKHALKHYKTPHSAVHSIIVNLTSWSTWCYICDEEVPINTKIQNCIDVIQKQLGIGHPEPLSPIVKQIDSPLTDSASSPMNNAFIKASPSVTCAKVKGLSNLGNTCFFNAVMQSMCQTRGLESLLLEKTKQERVITIDGPELGLESDSSSSDSEREEDSGEKLKVLPSIQTVYSDPGPITLTLLSFLQEMKGSTSKNGTVNPSALFTQVCKKAPRFKGFQQQDSHELLRYLVDCIRTEEIKRGQGSILRFFKLTENVNPKKVDDDTKTKIKEYGRQVKHTFLDFIFGGQLVSTVKCEECKNVSQIYEAFLDISVPVTEEKPQRPNFSLLGKKKDVAAVAAVADSVEDSAAADVSAMGLDAYTDRPSKYQEKKNKKIAKKDAKRKARLQKSKSLERKDSGSQGEMEEKGSPDGEQASDDSNKAADGSESGDAAKPIADKATASEDDNADVKQSEKQMQDSQGQGSMKTSTREGSKDSLCDHLDEESQDDPSDADVEDNLDGEQSHHNISSFNQAPKGNPNDKSDIKHNDMSTMLQTSDASMHNKQPDILRNGLTSNDDASNESGVRRLIADVNKLVISMAGESKQDSHGGNCVNDSPDAIKLKNGNDVISNNVDDNTTISSPSAVASEKSQQEGNASMHVDGAAGSSAGASTHHAFQRSKSNPDDPENAATKEEGVNDAMAKSEEKVSDDYNVLKTRQKHLKEAKHHAMNTLAPRYQPAPKECSILTCLNQFTAAELLTGSNKVACKECTFYKGKNVTSHKGLPAEKKGKDKVYSNANKQYLIFRPPCVLTLHLKRFEQTGLMSRKVNRHVDFPLVLDLAPYCSALASGVKEGQTKVLYSLYGIVEHSGRLSGGHYTAYIKVRPGVGSYTQFLHMHPPGAADVLNLFYERILKTKMKDNASSSMESCEDRYESLGAVDKDLESRAESLSPPGRWFHISDSRVNEVSEAMVLKAQAYLLFYERVF